jgi:hypothetical protein
MLSHLNRRPNKSYQSARDPGCRPHDREPGGCAKLLIQPPTQKEKDDYGKRKLSADRKVRAELGKNIPALFTLPLVVAGEVRFYG